MILWDQLYNSNLYNYKYTNNLRNQTKQTITSKTTQSRNFPKPKSRNLKKIRKNKKPNRQKKPHATPKQNPQPRRFKGKSLYCRWVFAYFRK
jgi:hypothetical protein